ncbi:MAG: type III-A CRISPR-associated protein Csm2 [Anaerolineae bacterium]
MANISNSTLQTIITDPNGAQVLVQEADKLGAQLQKQGLTTSQIRALFGEVRQIQAQWSMSEAERQKALRRLILLKPKMAYRAKREGRRVEELVSVLSPALDFVINEQDPQKQDGHFQRFVEFFEAILAYHKAYGGN